MKIKGGVLGVVELDAFYCDSSWSWRRVIFFFSFHFCPAMNMTSRPTEKSVLGLGLLWCGVPDMILEDEMVRHIQETTDKTVVQH